MSLPALMESLSNARKKISLESDIDYYSFVHLEERIASQEIRDEQNNPLTLLRNETVQMAEPYLHSLWHPDRNLVDIPKIIDLVASKLNDWEAVVSVLGSSFMSQVFEPNFDLLDDHCWLAFNYVCIWSALTWKLNNNGTYSREGRGRDILS